MFKRSLIFATLALIFGANCTCALAEGAHLGIGIHDVTDPELSNLRGRYIVGDNTVMWFGVEMITSLQVQTGQIVQSGLSIGMNFSKNPNSPQVTFVPTVTITTPNSPGGAALQDLVNRSIQSGGIANVGGMVQSVQIAGDNNAAANVTSLNIQDGGSAPNVTTTSNTNSTASSSSSSSSSAGVSVTGPMVNARSSTTSTITDANSVASTNTLPITSTTNTGTSTPDGRSANVGNAVATSTYTGDSATVTSAIAGLGSVSQWIHAGSMGQTIALSTDNAVATNQLIVNLVTRQTNSSEQVARSLARSLNVSRGL